MSGFLYFVEGVPAIGRERLEQLGIGYAFCGTGCAVRPVHAGPDGKAGVIVSGDSSQLGYFERSQAWRRVKRDPEIWLGLATDNPPGPSELALAEQLPGHQVKLRDGREWLVPCARQFDAGTPRRAVPARLDLNDEGQWVSGDVLPRYAKLWAAAERFADWYFGGEASGVLLVSELATMAVDALSVHYRLGPHEAAALGLFDDRGLAARDVMLAAIDWPTMQDWIDSQKKTSQSGDSLSSDGAAA